MATETASFISGKLPREHNNNESVFKHLVSVYQLINTSDKPSIFLAVKLFGLIETILPNLSGQHPSFLRMVKYYPVHLNST